MSRIRGKNTKPEMILRSQLFRLGFRFRVHPNELSGKPDIVLPKYRTAIFVHGCFWHFHKHCNEGRIPSSNSSFWGKKLQKNVDRDKAIIRTLKKEKWKVVVVWECEIEKKIDTILDKIISTLNKQTWD